MKNVIAIRSLRIAGEVLRFIDASMNRATPSEHSWRKQRLTFTEIDRRHQIRSPLNRCYQRGFRYRPTRSHQTASPTVEEARLDESRLGCRQLLEIGRLLAACSAFSLLVSAGTLGWLLERRRRLNWTTARAAASWCATATRSWAATSCVSSESIYHLYHAVPARHISEGTAPCPIYITPYPNLKKKKNYIYI